MAAKSSGRVRKAGGVRFSAETTDSSDDHDEHPTKTNEFQWEECCANGRSFELYFGILKLSHSYTMTLDILFEQASVQLQSTLDHEHTTGLQLAVSELPPCAKEHRSRYEVEVIIHSESIPGPFHRTFQLQEASCTSPRSMTVHVRGKILREGQGTATLRHGVHMKSIFKEVKEDDE